MSTFNKYDFLDDMKEFLLSEIQNGDLTNLDEIQEYIATELESQVIYYSDCFDICKSLCLTSFTGYELGDATDISQLAYFGLYEWTNEELDFSEIETALKNKMRNDTGN